MCMDLDEHFDQVLFHTSLSFFFSLHFCLVYSCSVKLFIFLSNISSHIYQSYVYKFSLMMIEICVIWSSLQLSYHISLTISSAAVKCCNSVIGIYHWPQCCAVQLAWLRYKDLAPLVSECFYFTCTCIHIPTKRVMLF